MAMSKKKLLAAVLVFVIFVSTNLNVSFVYPMSTPPAKEIAQHPASYLNQTLTVGGYINVQPMPAPFEIAIASENQSGVVHLGTNDALYVNWNSKESSLLDNNGQYVVVHGTIKVEAWTNPKLNQTYNYYYIDAQSVDFEGTKTTGFLGTGLPMEYGYAIIVAVVIVVVGLSLVYFKKLRK